MSQELVNRAIALASKTKTQFGPRTAEELSKEFKREIGGVIQAEPIHTGEPKRFSWIGDQIEICQAKLRLIHNCEQTSANYLVVIIKGRMEGTNQHAPKIINRRLCITPRSYTTHLGWLGHWLNT